MADKSGSISRSMRESTQNSCLNPASGGDGDVTEDPVFKQMIQVTEPTPEPVDDLGLPSFLSNDSILPFFTDDSDLPSFRPRSYSTTVLIHRQVAIDLRTISDSFNSLYDPNIADEEEVHMDFSDEELEALQMSRRASMPNIGRQRKSSLLGAIVNRYVPNSSRLQPLDSQARRAAAQAAGRRSQGSSVDGDDERESWSHQHRRERGEAVAERRRISREEAERRRSRIGSVPEDDNDDDDDLINSAKWI